VSDEKPPAATLYVADQEWVVENTPLRSDYGSSNGLMTQPVVRSAERLDIPLTWGARLMGVFFLGFGLGLVVADGILLMQGTLQKVLFGEAGWLTVPLFLGFMVQAALVGALTFFGTRILTLQTALDRAAGTVSRRWLLGYLWREPLSQVLAVQCLYAGRGSFSGLKLGRGSWDIYQINLVLSDSPVRKWRSIKRLNLCTEPDLEWTRASAAEIAKFLEVPLLDKIDATRAHYEEQEGVAEW
jgi:hypothetical protein